MKNADINANEGHERRCFFRVDDNTILQYRIMPHETEESIRRKKPQHLTSQLNVGARFAITTREMQPLLRTIKNTSPQVAQYLAAIDKKIDMLAELLLLTDKDNISQTPQKVNISAGGISIHTESHIPVDTILELRLILQPSNTGIFTYAKVVYSKHDNTDSARGNASYKVATEFIAMKDEDRDLISRHVLAREATRLRNKKERKLSALV